MKIRLCSYCGCNEPMSVDYSGVPEGQMVFCGEHSEIFLDACMAGMPAMAEGPSETIAIFTVVILIKPSQRQTPIETEPQTGINVHADPTSQTQTCQR